jgi:hypothetical protein
MKIISEVLDIDSEKGLAVLAALHYRRCDVVEVRVADRIIAVDVRTHHPTTGVVLVRTDHYDMKGRT